LLEHGPVVEKSAPTAALSAPVNIHP